MARPRLEALCLTRSRDAPGRLRHCESPSGRGARSIDVGYATRLYSGIQGLSPGLCMLYRVYSLARRTSSFIEVSEVSTADCHILYEIDNFSSSVIGLRRKGERTKLTLKTAPGESDLFNRFHGVSSSTILPSARTIRRSASMMVEIRWASRCNDDAR
jgi:hypothetical protein